MLKMNPSRIKRVIFDLDGTLIHHDIKNEGNNMCKLLNIPEEMKETFKYELTIFFSSHNKLLRNKKVTWDLYTNVVMTLIPCLQILGITPKKFEEALFEQNVCFSKIPDDVIPTLKYLVEKGHQLCIFTNYWYHNQSEIMKRGKILEYFERIYAWDNEYAKPDLRSIHRVIKGTNPLENVMVGDDLRNDIHLANAKLVWSIWLKHEGQKESQEIIIPDFTIEKIGELTNIL